MKKLGYKDEDANNYYNMVCVEIMVPGKQPNWGVTEAIAFPVLIERIMHQWKYKKLEMKTFDDFMELYFREMDAAIEEDYQEAIEKRKTMKDQCYDPYSSLLIDGCLEHGKDLLQGGSECPMHWSVYAYGIGTAADSLCAMKKFIFDEERITMEQMYHALQNNFEGYEELRAAVQRECPSYGNGIREVDDIADRILNHFTKTVMKLNQKIEKDKFVSTLFGYFFHIYHGEIAEATPDGRKKGEAFAPGANPMHNRDKSGAVASLLSVSKLPFMDAQDGISNTFSIIPGALGKDDEIYITNTGNCASCAPNEELDY